MLGRRGEEEIYTYTYLVARHSPTSSNESQSTMLIHLLIPFAITLQNAHTNTMASNKYIEEKINGEETNVSSNKWQLEIVW